MLREVENHRFSLGNELNCQKTKSKQEKETFDIVTKSSFIEFFGFIYPDVFFIHRMCAMNILVEGKSTLS